MINGSQRSHGINIPSIHTPTSRTETHNLFAGDTVLPRPQNLIKNGIIDSAVSVQTILLFFFLYFIIFITVYTQIKGRRPIM